MGFVEAGTVRNEVADLMGLDWEQLGRVVRQRTLNEVARHFLNVGLAEICLEALAEQRPEAFEVQSHE